jgi:hypothetical protein
MQSRQRLGIAFALLIALVTIVGLSAINSGHTCRPDITTWTCDRTDPELTRLIR